MLCDFYYKMKQSNQSILIFVKDNRLNQIPITNQTMNIHNKTNTKIRELGDKYYETKKIFDRLKIQRDNLFVLGKYLEEEYKDKKDGIKLQSQMKRSKDALICWFSEFFYDEMFDPKSKILQRLIAIQNTIFPKKVEILTKKSKKSHSKNMQIEIESPKKENIIPDSTNIISNEENDISTSNELKFNQEIDTFDYPNDKNEQISNTQNNFSFDDLLSL